MDGEDAVPDTWSEVCMGIDSDWWKIFLQVGAQLRSPLDMSTWRFVRQCGGELLFYFSTVCFGSLTRMLTCEKCGDTCRSWTSYLVLLPIIVSGLES